MSIELKLSEMTDKNLSSLDRFQHLNKLFQEPAWMQPSSRLNELLALQQKLLGPALAFAGIHNDGATRAAALAASSLAGFPHGQAMKAAQLASAFDTSKFGSVSDVLKSMQQLPDHSLLASISSMPESLRKMTEALSHSNFDFQHLHGLATTASLAGQSYQAMMRSYGMDTLADRLSSFDWPDSITVNDDDSITVDESTIGSIEVRNAITQVSDAVTHQRLQKLEEQLIEFVEQSKQQLSPALQAIFIPLVLSLFFAFFNPVAEFVAQKYLDDDTQMQKTTSDQSPSLTSFRLVKRKVLSVRAKASRNARALGNLHADQVVTMIEERDEWALVSWSNQDNSLSLQGWVLSKYLRELQ